MLLTESVVKFAFVEQVSRGHSAKRTMKERNYKSLANVSQNNSHHGKKRFINSVIQHLFQSRISVTIFLFK